LSVSNAHMLMDFSLNPRRDSSHSFITQLLGILLTFFTGVLLIVLRYVQTLAA